jgi:hypothetical protein
VGPLGGFWFSLFRFPSNLDSDSVTLLGGSLEFRFFTRHAHLNNLSNK